MSSPKLCHLQQNPNLNPQPQPKLRRNLYSNPNPLDLTWNTCVWKSRSTQLFAPYHILLRLLIHLNSRPQTDPQN